MARQSGLWRGIGGFFQKRAARGFSARSRRAGHKTGLGLGVRRLGAELLEDRCLLAALPTLASLGSPAPDVADGSPVALTRQANGPTTYYVNDSSTTNDLWCTAVGNDANDGLTPATPKATVQAILSANTLQPGDTVQIDTGSYTLASEISVGGASMGSSTAPLTFMASPYGVTFDSSNGYGWDIGSPYVILTTAVDAVPKYPAVAQSWMRITGGGRGVHVAGDYDQVSRCDITGNFDGIAIDGMGSTLQNDVVHGNSGYGINIGGTATTVQNCTIYGNLGDGIYVWGVSGTVLRNNIVWADGAGVNAVNSADPSWLSTADYNDLYATNGANIGYNSPTLTDWQQVTGMEIHSLSLDPLFANAAGGDFHEKSGAGRYDPSLGLAPSNPAAWVSDTSTSPCIDRGDPASTYSDESLPNGGRINMGAYGDTAQASRSVATAATVVGRHVFYNDSSFDGNDPGANALDDAAIATDKQALTPGQTASFANVTSYTRGLNGIMIDIQNLATTQLLAADFAFSVGNGSPVTWTDFGVAPTIAAARAGAGDGSSNRVTLTWPDYDLFNEQPNMAAHNQWLRVTVKAGTDTGLAADDVFYFGNLVGFGGYNLGDPTILVDTVQEAINIALHTGGGAAGITSPYDVNRNGAANIQDAIFSVMNTPKSLNLWTAPSSLTLAPLTLSLSASAPQTSPTDASLPTTQSATAAVTRAAITTVVPAATTTVVPQASATIATAAMAPASPVADLAIETRRAIVAASLDNGVIPGGTMSIDRTIAGYGALIDQAALRDPGYQRADFEAGRPTLGQREAVQPDLVTAVCRKLESVPDLSGVAFSAHQAFNGPLGSVRRNRGLLDAALTSQTDWKPVIGRDDGEPSSS